MNRTAVIAALVLTTLLVSAGCATGPRAERGAGVATPTPTRTGAGTGVGGSAAGTNGTVAGEFPAGLTAGGVDDAAARDRTLSLLREGPVVVVARERFRPGAYADYRFKGNATRVRFRLDVHNGDADVTERDTYVDETGWYDRRVRDGRTTYAVSNASAAATRERAAPIVWAVLSRILVLGEFRATERRADGGFRYALSGTVLDNASDAEGHLVVDADGLIREARLAYTVRGERKRFRYEVRRRAGVAVDPPGWVEELRDEGERGTPVSLAGVEGTATDRRPPGADRDRWPSPALPAALSAVGSGVAALAGRD